MDLPKILRDAYHKDAMFSKIMVHPDAHKKFSIRDGLIWTKKSAPAQHRLHAPECISRGKEDD
jgi:hypothetical protein